MLIAPNGKPHFFVLDPNRAIHTSDGVLKMADFIGLEYGRKVCSHLGREFRILKPTLYDLNMNLKRRTQIIYPKEVGYILMKLGIGPGVRVIEAGSGSGGLTVSFAWCVGNEGRVYTYERRPEHAELCGENLAWAGLSHRVEQFNHDIEEGFLQEEADALFLDVREPWLYLDQALAATIPGAPLGFLLPTTNQVSELLTGMQGRTFADIEVLEILLRRYKPVPDRLRPDDRMVAHTGFLIFARNDRV